MKALNFLIAMGLVVATSAFASQTITGQLVENTTIPGFGTGFQVMTQDTIYTLDIPGNTCGKAYTVFKLRDAVGATVELTGEPEEATLKHVCGAYTESFLFGLGRGDEIKILEPAPTH